MYDYTKERGVVFTEDGIKLLFKIRDNAQRLLKMAGAFREQEVYGGCSGDSWAMLACVDYLVELGEIRRVTEVCSTVKTVGKEGIYVGGKDGSATVENETSCS